MTSASITGLAGLISMNSAYSGALVNYGFSQGDIGKFNAEFDTSRAYTPTP